MEFRIVGVGMQTWDYVLETLLHSAKANDSVNPINRINQISYGWLGNLRILTYSVDIPEEVDYMVTRREVMNALTQPGSPVEAMYKHGVIDEVYIFQKAAFRKDEYDSL